MGLGPGFSRPLPYAVAAIIISIAGHLIHRWLHPGSGHGISGSGSKDSVKTGALRRIFKEPLRGLSGFFRGTAAFNNFIFLSIAYILGIGLTSLFIRKDAQETSSATYWRDLNLGKQDADAYYRPF